MALERLSMATPAASQTGPSGKLREEYSAAEAEERAAWRALDDTTLGEVERRQIYARWTLAACLTRMLAGKLQNLPSRPGSKHPSQ
jgi:hypothetical protein